MVGDLFLKYTWPLTGSHLVAYPYNTHHFSLTSLLHIKIHFQTTVQMIVMKGISGSVYMFASA